MRIFRHHRNQKTGEGARHESLHAYSKCAILIDAHIYLENSVSLNKMLQKKGVGVGGSHQVMILAMTLRYWIKVKLFILNETSMFYVEIENEPVIEVILRSK